ncbi:MAG: hypothetical protein GY841_12350 [FCB group bacterium]|nr:hypothetical protein [FCB group bacterium]
MAINFMEMAEGKKDITPADPFNLDRVLEPFKKYEMTIAEWKKRVAALVVSDDESAAAATEMGVQVANIIKTMDVERKAAKAEPDKFVRAIDAFFRKFKAPLDQIKKDLKKNIGDYAYKQELERRKREKAAQDEQRRLQAEMDKAAKKAKVEPVQMPEIVAPKKQAPVRSDSGSASVRMKWTFEILDEKVIGRNYLSVDGKKIQSAIDGGIRQIAGVRVYEKPIVSIRT